MQAPRDRLTAGTTARRHEAAPTRRRAEANGAQHRNRAARSAAGSRHRNAREGLHGAEPSPRRRRRRQTAASAPLAGL